MSLCLVAVESLVSLPDLASRQHGWEVESLIVPCEVLLVRNQGTSSGFRLLKLLLVVVIVTVDFYAENVSVQIRFKQIWQPKHGKRPYKVWFETFIVCRIQFCVRFCVKFLNKECLLENFIPDAKITLKNVYCVFCCIFCRLRLSSLDEVV